MQIITSIVSSHLIKLLIKVSKIKNNFNNSNMSYKANVIKNNTSVNLINPLNKSNGSFTEDDNNYLNEPNI